MNPFLSHFPRLLPILFCMASVSCARGPAPRPPVVTVTVPPSRQSPRDERQGQSEEHALDADFDHRVRLVSYRLTPDLVAADDEVVLTLSWKRGAAVDTDWLFFVHVENGPQTIFGDPNRVPAATCALNAICTYEVRFRAPQDFSRLDVFAGLWRGADRMPIVRGRADDNQRAVVASVPRSPK